MVTILGLLQNRRHFKVRCNVYLPLIAVYFVLIEPSYDHFTCAYRLDRIKGDTDVAIIILPRGTLSCRKHKKIPRPVAKKLYDVSSAEVVHVVTYLFIYESSKYYHYLLSSYPMPASTKPWESRMTQGLNLRSRQCEVA